MMAAYLRQLLVTFFLIFVQANSFLNTPTNTVFHRQLLYGPNNNNSSNIKPFSSLISSTQPIDTSNRITMLSRRSDYTFSSLPPSTTSTTKLDFKLEAGAKRWQAAMNASLVDIFTTNTTLASPFQPSNLVVVKGEGNEIAHSEPLKNVIVNKHRGSISTATIKKKKKVPIMAEEESAPEEEEALPPFQIDYDDENSVVGSSQPPACSISSGKHYCSFKEDSGSYPTEVVNKIVQYYKYPLQSLFGTALSQQIMPQLANDGSTSGSSSSGLVCEATTRLMRPGWALNTSGRWLAVLNTDHYQQYVTEVLCSGKGAGSSCNYVPPCFSAICTQRYNTQKLLVVDPAVPHRGPFLSEFLFPSCCVCHVRSVVGKGKSNSKAPINVSEQKKAKA